MAREGTCDDPRSAATAAPTRVGSCEIHAELASGGTASVFIGLQRGAGGFEKVVAIKRLLPVFAFDADYHAMMADEASVSARTDHPHVRDVFDFGIAEDGSPYMVMEFLFGQNLSTVHRAVAAQPDMLREPRYRVIVARLIAQLCEGLHAVHELAEDGGPLEVVHRDITPHNLFVLYDGSVRVTDFGIVRARVRKQAPSGMALKGKLPYMSPEYLGRKPYDRRSDVWAMGVVLWEMLTGSRLFRKDSDASTVRAIVSAPVPPPSQLVSDIDKRLDAIVQKALNRNVEGRYRTARELANDLEEWIARERRAVTPSDVGTWLEGLTPTGKADLSRLVNSARKGARPPRNPTPMRPPASQPRSHSRPTLAAMRPPSVVFAAQRRSSVPQLPAAPRSSPPSDRPAAMERTVRHVPGPTGR